MSQHSPQPDNAQVMGGIISAVILHRGSVLGVCLLWSLAVGTGWLAGVIAGGVAGVVIGTFLGLTTHGRREYSIAAGGLCFPIWIILAVIAAIVWVVRSFVV